MLGFGRNLRLSCLEHALSFILCFGSRPLIRLRGKGITQGTCRWQPPKQVVRFFWSAWATPIQVACHIVLTDGLKIQVSGQKCRFSDKKLWTGFADGCDFPKSLAAALRSQAIFKCKIWWQWWYYDSWNGFNPSQNPKQVFCNSSGNPKQVFFKFFQVCFNFLKPSQTTSIQVAGKFQTTSPEGTKQDSMDEKGNFFNFLKTHL